MSDEEMRFLESLRRASTDLPPSDAPVKSPRRLGVGDHDPVDADEGGAMSYSKFAADAENEGAEDESADAETEAEDEARRHAMGELVEFVETTHRALAAYRDAARAVTSEAEDAEAMEELEAVEDAEAALQNLLALWKKRRTAVAGSLGLSD